MKEKCPFAVASPVATPAATKASFAANWYVSGIARVGDQNFVSIKARDLSTQFSLFGSEPNEKAGVTLVSVQWSEAIGKSTVVLRKGNETAQLEFNEAEVHANPATPAGKTAANAPAPGAVAAASSPGPAGRVTPTAMPPRPAPRPPGSAPAAANAPAGTRTVVGAPSVGANGLPNRPAIPTQAAQPVQRRVVIPQMPPSQ